MTIRIHPANTAYKASLVDLGIAAQVSAAPVQFQQQAFRATGGQRWRFDSDSDDARRRVELSRKMESLENMDNDYNYNIRCWRAAPAFADMAYAGDYRHAVTELYELARKVKVTRFELVQSDEHYDRLEPVEHGVYDAIEGTITVQ